MRITDWTACPECNYRYVRVVQLSDGRIGFSCERCETREAYAVVELAPRPV